MVPPRFAPARDRSRLTHGPSVAKVAEALGQPLMPWQRYVADVAGEVDGRGRYLRPLVVVSIQRQAGKTTLMLAQALHRCLQGPNRRAWVTAQTGLDARDKFREFADLVMDSPLRQVVKERRKGAGSEWLQFVNGSTLRPHPPQRDALHGKQSDHNDIDEGWSFDEVHGDDLFQAINPTQATRPGAQTFVWSTRGDASSTWFHGLIERGYAGELALFDWGIPFDADPTDLDVIADFHPAVGRPEDGYVIERDFFPRARESMPDPAQFARAYGNVPTGAAERVIPPAAWNAARVTAPLPEGRPAYGVAVSMDGDHGALVAAVAGPDGSPWVEVIEHRPGRSWLVDRVLALHDPGLGVAVDRRGPAGPIADALELAGVAPLTPTTIDYAAGCQDLFDRLTDPGGPRLFHRDHPALDAAVDVAGRRRLEEGGWVWSRKRSTGDVSTLEAATLAAWAVARTPAPLEIGHVYFR